MNALLVDGLVLVGLALPGYLLSRLVLTEGRTPDHLALAFPLGAGITTWGLFLGSLAGLRLTEVTCLVVWFALCAGTAAAIILRGRRPAGGEQGTGIRCGWNVPGAALVALVLVLSCLIALGNSYSAWDGAAIWSIKGYGIAKEGTIFAADSYGSHGLAYPLNIPLLISLFALASGDVVPGSILVFPLFQASMLLGVLATWQRSGVRRGAGLLGVALLASIPAHFEQSTIGMANVPMTAYLVLGALFAIQGTFDGRRGAHLVSGILLGLACWTRVEGVLFVAAIVLAVLAGRLLARRGSVSLLPWLLPILVIGGSWLVFYRLEGAQGAQATRAVDKLLDAWRTSGFGLAPARIMFGYLRRSLFAPGIWGAIFPAILGLLLYGAPLLRPTRGAGITATVLAGLAAGLTTLVIFFVGSYISSGLFGWMTRGFPREFLATPVLMLVAAVQAADRQWMERRLAPMRPG